MADPNFVASNQPQATNAPVVALTRGRPGLPQPVTHPGVLPVLAVLPVQRSAAELWRRYLTLILDGLRPGREGVTPLPVAAMLPEEMEKGMRQAAPRHR